jgi:molecular chaperone DnaJ
VRVQAGTEAGERLRVVGEGFYKVGTNEKGNHYVDLKVDIPKKVTEKERKIF